MTISIDAKKAFDKIQHPFIIKTLNKVGIEGTYQHNKSHLQQTHIKYNTQWRKAESLPTKIWKKTRIPLSALIFNIVLEVLNTAVGQTKELKCIQIGRQEVKLSLCADDMIVYIENHKDSTPKLLKLINEFSKVADTRLAFRNHLHFCILTNIRKGI